MDKYIAELIQLEEANPPRYAFIGTVTVYDNGFLGTDLLDISCLRGHLDSAGNMFNKMPKKDVDSCKSIHGYVVRRCICGVVSNSLIDMYSKCGALKKAKELFLSLEERDLGAWCDKCITFTQHCTNTQEAMYHCKGPSLSKALSEDILYPLISAKHAKVANVSAENAELCKKGTIDPEKVKGNILVCLRGVSARVDKSLVALEAGAAGMILFNDEHDSYDDFELITDPHLLPASELNYKYGLAILAYINSTKGSFHFKQWDLGGRFNCANHNLEDKVVVEGWSNDTHHGLAQSPTQIMGPNLLKTPKPKEVRAQREKELHAWMKDFA